MNRLMKEEIWSQREDGLPGGESARIPVLWRVDGIEEGSAVRFSTSGTFRRTGDGTVGAKVDLMLHELLVAEMAMSKCEAT